MEHVPKRLGLLREAVILHPTHRILYLATLKHLIAKLDKSLLPESYSYRLDATESPDDYPFAQRMERWKSFHNDFRAASLVDGAKFVVLTDLASFYDHISCDQLADRILSLLGESRGPEDKAVVELLTHMLKLWSTDGHGIPQNLDPSSFFGSLYLHVIDSEMVTQGYRYSRWVDDIRIVTASRDEAVQALHTLQRCLGKSRLFLAAGKTEIVERESLRWNSLMDVSDDVLISEIEERLT